MTHGHVYDKRYGKWMDIKMKCKIGFSKKM